MKYYIDKLTSKLPSAIEPDNISSKCKNQTLNLELPLLKPPLCGHHITACTTFEFKYAARFHWKCGSAGLISLSPFMTIFTNFGGFKCFKNQYKDEAGRFHFTFNNRWEIWYGCNFEVITMRGQGIPISWLCKLMWGRGTQIQTRSWPKKDNSKVILLLFLKVYKV